MAKRRRDYFTTTSSHLRQEFCKRLYGFVQLPIYQRVNGTQLTADWAAVAGISKIW